MRILITGSRRDNDFNKVFRQLVQYKHDCVTLIHGGAPGIDEIADRIANMWDWDVEVYPADWDSFGNAAGPMRNQQMVDSGADICIAFPAPDSKGTWNCVNKARSAKIKTIVIGD